MTSALHLILPADLDSVVIHMIGAYVAASGIGGFVAGLVVACSWRWAIR